MSKPATNALPLVGGKGVVSIFIKVLFPAPFGPTIEDFSAGHREADVVGCQNMTETTAEVAGFDDSLGALPRFSHDCASA